jgi:lipoprotein signal peptidase
MEAVSLPAAQPRSPRAVLHALAPWVVGIGFGTVLDQLAKRWAEQHIRMRGIVTLIPDVLDLRFARNPGAFFSLGAALPDALRRTLLCTASLLVLAIILRLYRRTPPEQRALRWGLALLSGGALGNLIDRVRAGEVTDFVHLHAGAVLHWATFNIADVAITIGLGLLAFDLLRPRSAAHGERSSAPALDGGRG